MGNKTIKEELVELFRACDLFIKSCDIDYNELVPKKIDEKFFGDHENARVVNSFLFNFSKLQDKIGAKLLKKLLYELREIDDFSVAMIDVLNIAEKLGVIRDRNDWEELRELRNALTHEYPFDMEEKIANIKKSLQEYLKLKQIYNNIKAYSKQHGVLS